MSVCASIVICTRDRADSLRETLASIGRCAVPADLPTELLVVDNGSTDHTRQVVDRAGLTNMLVQYVWAAGQGKSHAYNTGMDRASGSIYLFTDDDLRVPVSWIEVMCRPIARGDADATTGEIRIAPNLLQPWMRDAHRRALLEIGNLAQQHVREPFMIGANMACSADARRSIEGFCEALGPGRLGNMEDTLFYLQLLQTGKRISFVAGHAVEHHFEASRCTREVQLRQAKALGQSTAWVMHHWSHERVPKRRRRLIANTVRLAGHAIRWHLRGLLSGIAVEGFSPEEVQHAQRYWTYRELGQLAGTPRAYEKHGLRRREATLSEVDWEDSEMPAVRGVL